MQEFSSIKAHILQSLHPWVSIYTQVHIDTYTLTTGILRPLHRVA